MSKYPEPSKHPTQRPPQRRGDAGLTTLEWLLIVAAVAGLAALAVVLVQNVVGDTSEQISGNNARVTAAQLAAKQVADEAVKAGNDSTNLGNDLASINAKYARECRQQGIFYADAGVQTTWSPGTESSGAWDNEPECTVSARSAAASPAAPGTPTNLAYSSPNLTWDEPSGSPTGYTVTCTGTGCPTGGPWMATTNRHNVGVLQGSGDPYSFVVKATNSGGDSLDSAPLTGTS